jgi:hypothetical protein
VRIEENDRSRQYELVPDSMLIAPLKELPDIKNYKLRLSIVQGFVFPDESVINRFSFSLLEDPKNKKDPVRKWDLYNGKRLLLREDFDRNSTFEHVVIFNDNGIALRGLYDNDGDGSYEISEIYKNGVVERIEFDENKDGKPDYIQNADGTKKEWDLNNDGIIDIIETRTNKGKIVWQYTGLFQKTR